MKKQLFSFIFAGFFLLSISTFAQSNNYPVTVVNGVEYFQYTVEPSEGLLSIGQKFDISADDISKANPEVKNGLKSGQQILIPISKKTRKKLLNQKKLQQEFIQHKVEKKQTLFSISQKYKISEEDIIKYNPGIEKNGLQEGTILQIPKLLKETKSKEIVKPLNNTSKDLPTGIIEKKIKFSTYKVHANETLFSISRRFKIDINDIIKYNHGCDSKLVVGSDLKIPSYTTSKLKTQNEDTIVIGPKSIKNEIVTEKSNTGKYSENKTIRIAFLLPLMLDQIKKDPNDERFINFYEGSLLAIKEARQKGISFEIYAYDTEKSEDRVNEILNNSELKTMDLIIGPAFSNLVPIVESFAKENKINTLIPFSSKVPDIDTNPFLFQFNPGQDSELNFFTDLITGKYKNTHLIFADIQDINQSDEGKIRVDLLKKTLTKEHRNFSTIELSTSENVNFSTTLKKGERNLIIFNSDKLSNVSHFINSIKEKSTLYDIVLFEQYNWRNQIDKAIHTIYISPFITKFNPNSINEFNLQFDQYFGKDVTADSPRYDLLGYDLSNYFIALIHRYGSKFGNKINSINSDKSIQSEPLFERSSNNSGFINQRVYLGEDKVQ